MASEGMPLKINAKLRKSFRTRWQPAAMSTFESVVSQEISKISPQETMATLRDLCEELVTFETKTSIENMSERVRKMCDIAKSAFETDTTLDAATHEQQKTELEQIKANARQAWERKTQLSKRNTDLRHRHKAEENELLATFQNLVGRVELVGMDGALTDEHVQDMAQVANATTKKNLKFEVETRSLGDVLEGFQTNDPRTPRPAAMVFQPKWKQAHFNRTARDKHSLQGVANFMQSYLEGLRNQETTQLIHVVNRSQHKHTLPHLDQTYPPTLVHDTQRFDVLVEKYRYGKALLSKVKQVNPFQLEQESDDMKTKRREVDEIFAMLYHTFLNPSDGNTHMVIDGGHRMFGLYLVRMNIVPILKTKQGVLVFYDDLLHAPHASELKLLSKSILFDTKLTFRIYDESITDEMAARICYSNMLCHQTTPAQKLFARNPCMAFGTNIVRMLSLPDQLDDMGLLELMQTWKFESILSEDVFVVLAYSLSMVMMTEPLLDLVSGPMDGRGFQYGVSKGKPMEIEQYLQRLGWIDVDGPYGRMTQQDMEDEFLREYYDEKMTREMFLVTACSRLSWCKRIVALFEKLQCGTPLANWSSAFFIIAFLRNPEYQVVVCCFFFCAILPQILHRLLCWIFKTCVFQGDDVWHVDAMPLEAQVFFAVWCHCVAKTFFSSSFFWAKETYVFS